VQGWVKSRTARKQNLQFHKVIERRTHAGSKFIRFINRRVSREHTHVGYDEAGGHCRSTKRIHIAHGECLP
jgi:hypothetical protein